uniref:t-SNARE coiled-coil homology domain-containing protein n=1 Tax=Spongospora subterranea TaxID=70186 RepID=A0A0H5R9D7_9EUKA|eukprot:CRZ10738.1 hypothetical protein [Spongospora subterranea]
MACRNLTARFTAERQHWRSFGATLDGNAEPDGDEDGLLSNGYNAGLGSGGPPVWVDIVEEIENNLVDINKGITALAELHNKRLKVSFSDDEQEQDKTIDAKAQAITSFFRKSEAKLKRIATIGNLSATSLSQEEKTVRLNVMRSLGAKLQNSSKQFRNMQKDFLLRLQGRNDSTNKFFDEDDTRRRSFEEGLDTGFTESQLVQLEEAKSSTDEREREIAQIAQSINDLAMIFRELSILVVEQGSVLDRIDYNVEQSMQQVKAGTTELLKAEEYQKRGKTTCCIVILFMACLICILILIFRR